MRGGAGAGLRAGPAGADAGPVPSPHHPPAVRSALRMLEGRNNKEAQEFVKRLKELEKYMEADP